MEHSARERPGAPPRVGRKSWIREFTELGGDPGRGGPRWSSGWQDSARRPAGLPPRRGRRSPVLRRDSSGESGARRRGAHRSLRARAQPLRPTTSRRSPGSRPRPRAAKARGPRSGAVAAQAPAGAEPRCGRLLGGCGRRLVPAQRVLEVRGWSSARRPAIRRGTAAPRVRGLGRTASSSPSRPRAVSSCSARTAASSRSASHCRTPGRRGRCARRAATSSSSESASAGAARPRARRALARRPCTRRSRSSGCSRRSRRPRRRGRDVRPACAASTSASTARL